MSVAEPKERAPEVYRSTPFEYMMTAEALQFLLTCTQRVPTTGAWTDNPGTLEHLPPLPDWMRVP